MPTGNEALQFYDNVCFTVFFVPGNISKREKIGSIWWREADAGDYSHDYMNRNFH